MQAAEMTPTGLGETMTIPGTSPEFREDDRHDMHNERKKPYQVNYLSD